MKKLFLLPVRNLPFFPLLLALGLLAVSLAPTSSVSGNALDSAQTDGRNNGDQNTGLNNQADQICPDRLAIDEGGNTLWLPLCSNVDIRQGSQSADSAIIVIHGTNRNSVDYYGYAMEARQAANSLNSIVIAPQFLIDRDIAELGLPSDMAYWSSGGWKQGDKSQNKPYRRPFTVSSFAVIDQLVRLLADGKAFPNLSSVVVVGHSAGGQFVNRYAAVSNIETEIKTSGMGMKYLVANPSSYLYLSDERNSFEPSGEFVKPTAIQTESCPDYNDYKYGLRDLNSYAKLTGIDLIRAQYVHRDVVYLLGSEDTDRASSSLDTSCEADFQGYNRLERGNIYFGYLGAFYGPPVYSSQTRIIVDGVGHSARAMLNSPETRGQIFPINR